MKRLMNKKGFLLRDFVIVGIIFGMIVGLYVLQVASIDNEYGGNTGIINPNFAAHYSNLQLQLSKLDAANKAVQSPGGLNLIGTFNVAFNSIFTVITMVWDGITIYTGMAGNIPGDFSFLDSGTVTIVLGGAIAILTTYLIFVWLSSITRGKI